MQIGKSFSRIIDRFLLVSPKTKTKENEVAEIIYWLRKSRHAIENERILENNYYSKINESIRSFCLHFENNSNVYEQKRITIHIECHRFQTEIDFEIDSWNFWKSVGIPYTTPAYDQLYMRIISINISMHTRIRACVCVVVGILISISKRMAHQGFRTRENSEILLKIFSCKRMSCYLSKMGELTVRLQILFFLQYNTLEKRKENL